MEEWGRVVTGVWLCVCVSSTIRNLEVLIDLIPTTGGYKIAELNCQQNQDHTRKAMGFQVVSCQVLPGKTPANQWMHNIPIYQAGRGFAPVWVRSEVTITAQYTAFCGWESLPFRRYTCAFPNVPYVLSVLLCVCVWVCVSVFFSYQNFFTNCDNSQIFLCLFLVAAVQTDFRLAYDFNTS